MKNPKQNLIEFISKIQTKLIKQNTTSIDVCHVPMYNGKIASSLHRLIINTNESPEEICEEYYNTYLDILIREGIIDNLIKIEKTEDDVIIPKYETNLAVGMDLRSNEGGIHLKPGETIIVSTGIKMKLPDNIECQIRSRSGLSTKGIIVANSPGTIDPDYRGEIKVILTNLGKESFIINKYDRIAQLVFSPILRVILHETDHLNPTVRGEGGFGSTGV